MKGSFICPNCFTHNACSCDTCKPFIKEGEYVNTWSEDGEAHICGKCSKLYSPDQSLDMEDKLRNNTMTVEDFNNKYKEYLEEGHYGLAVSDPLFIIWLDEKFQGFIKKPGFSYSQIKFKFKFGRFYCEGLTTEEISEVEDKLCLIY